ncbi:beta-1,3-galactosyltransferase 2-like [Mizuhopecten yessoensis]|uniref:Beta-1,3-galactosyltransferase brn n=1 Tax=Mizuhopecten yessoensis TaxID=6573 RepID=A0A210R6Z7_MIZYE|nr:beta-1,3-galactosyltransferase 2-like [Mizuhopecten yessoensis]XP_021355403.1 beta-1,3-galactosyltransferase 2-like [Mizuhopecten yessoensis]XP_021355480.1 beta-1,3-galactosyltransferase 2-like [Mizuhopecten yessoensis]XP_021355553.1 beta-1,3-galactosyltransferase 2-like [Mizuhopecten yessoensis]OWF56823.1 Beta-1,3-galactosyltransferase brn [Mizuhopecten yessoensis]
MRALTRYKYAHIRVFRPMRRTRRTFCVVSCTVLLFGLCTLLLEIFNTSDRYRTLSMVPYSGNLSELKEHHLVSSVTRAQTLVREPVLIAINEKPVQHKHYNHSRVVQTSPGHHNSKHSPSNLTHNLSIVSNISQKLINGTVVSATNSGKIVTPVNMTSSDSKPRNTSVVSKGNVENQGIKAKRKSIYLSYKVNFVYPLDINIAALVNDTIQGLEYTKHKPINPHNFWYLHKPYNCAFKLKPNATKNVLVLVKSFVGNVAQRMALRTLWQATNDSNMRRVFMLGYNRSHQLVVDNESRKYRDIIQENFVDNYMNNTYKTIMAFNWATKYCRRAHAILFLDDDYLVNMTVMAAHVRTSYRNQSSGLYAGTLAKHAPPYRDKNERWYLNFKQYPYDEFPPYVGGGAYIVSFDVAKRFKFAFPYVQYMGIDDVYLGIVARKLGIEASNDPYLDGHSKVTIAKECSHNATELLKRVCPLGIIKKKRGRTYRRVRHKPVNASIFVLCFCIAISAIVLLTCCVAE